MPPTDNDGHHVGEALLTGSGRSLPDAPPRLPEYLLRMVELKKFDIQVAVEIARYQAEEAQSRMIIEDALLPLSSLQPTSSYDPWTCQVIPSMATLPLAMHGTAADQLLPGTPTVGIAIEPHTPRPSAAQPNDNDNDNAMEVSVTPDAAAAASSPSSGGSGMGLAFGSVDASEVQQFLDEHAPDQPSNERKRKRDKAETPDTRDPDQVVTGEGFLTPTDIIKFFRVNGICPDQRYRDDAVATVRAFGRNQDRDGFVQHVKNVNETVDSFVEQFEHTGKVAALLNKIPLRTRSHAGMRANLLSEKLKGTAVSFQEEQKDRTFKKHTTKQPLLSTIVQEFSFFMREFSIDKCGAGAADVTFAKGYYLPDSKKFPHLNTDVYKLLRLNCGIGGVVDVGAMAGPAAAAVPRDQANAERPAPQPMDDDRAGAAAMTIDPQGDGVVLSHDEAYYLHFDCDAYIPPVPTNLSYLNRTTGVELVEKYRPDWSLDLGGYSHAGWAVFLRKARLITVGDGFVCEPTGDDLSQSTEFLGKGHHVLIMVKPSDFIDLLESGDAGQGDGGQSEGGHGHDPGNSSDHMDEDPAPDQGRGMSPYPGGGYGGGGFGSGGNEHTHNSTDTTGTSDDLSEAGSDCTEGQLQTNTPSRAIAPRRSEPQPVLKINGHFAQVVFPVNPPAARALLSLRGLLLSQALPACCLEAPRLLALTQRDARLSVAVLFPFSVPQKLACLSQPGQPRPMSETQIETWKRQLVSAASFLQPIPQLFQHSEFLVVGSPLRLLVAAGHFESTRAAAVEAAQPPTITTPKHHQWAETFDEVMRGLANNTVTHAALTSLTLEQVGLLAAALTLNTSLIVLNLEKNQIGEAGAQELAVALRFNRTLKVLNLDHTGVGDGGVTFIAGALNCNQSLETLHLNGNKIGEVGAKSLAKVLANNHSLERLYVGWNWIENGGATSLGEALATNKRLSKLYLNQNRIGDEGVAAIGVQCVRACSLQLQELRLDGNAGISADVIVAVKAANPSLQIAWRRPAGSKKKGHAAEAALGMKPDGYWVNRLMEIVRLKAALHP